MRHAGKTHTMYGAENEVGIIDMAIDELFHLMKDRQFQMKVIVIK